MVHYQLSSLLRVVVGLILLGQIFPVQCSPQLQLRPKKRPHRKQRVTGGIPPQPIGIDFGPEYVIAAYAHSPTNVTILSMISVKNGSYDAYFENMMLLRLANDNRVLGMAQLSSGPTPIPTGEQILATVKKMMRSYLPTLMPTIPFFGSSEDSDSVDEDPESTLWIRMHSFLDWATDITDSAIIYALDKGMEFSGIITSHEILRRRSKLITDRDIKESFYPIIHELKDSAMKNHNVSIDFAILSLPEYFPPQHEYIPTRACNFFGIRTPELSIPKTLAAVASVDTKPDARILLVDHGRYHTVLQTLKRDGNKKHNPILDLAIPYDAYRGEVLEKNLYVRITSKGVLKDQLELKKKFNLDEKQMTLRHEIERARVLIKDNVFDWEDDSEDHHHDEWPLNLDNWWSIIEGWGPTSIPSVVLSWEDVQAVEEEYTNHLSTNLDTLLRSVRTMREEDENLKKSDLGPQQEIDAVIITTDQLHGSLIRRAAKLAVGDGVRIYGGRIPDLTMAAEGAAILALKRRRNWDDMQEFEEGLTLVQPVCNGRL